MADVPPPNDVGMPKEPINLMRGWPNPSLLPVDLIKSAANTALSDPAVAHAGLLYGPDPGYEACREAVADWLTSFYQPQQKIDADRICITGGASQNLGCMLGVYTDPEYTRNIWIVAPAYMLAFRVFEDAGFGGKMRAVVEDEEGIDLHHLRQELQKSEKRATEKGVERPRYKPERKRAKVYKHIVYCVPTFANPSSRTMSLRRREDLVKLAREYDALVVADDVYDFLQWPAHPSQQASTASSLPAMQTAHLPRLVDIDRALDGGAARDGADGFGNVCSNGSFSKIAGPGIRVGWLEGTEKFAYGVSQAGVTASGGAPSQLTSTYITTLLTTGQLHHHITTVLRPAYTARYHTLMRAITAHLLPLGFSLPQPDRDVVGGYFVWLALPASLSATRLAQRCKHCGDDDDAVIIAPGPIFEVPGDESAAGFDGHVRLCFAWEEEWKLAEGVRRVGEVAKRMLEDHDGEAGNGGYVVVEREARGGMDQYK
ncbi:hypothetical protein LTR36_003404 [Oleoguttula mirabilis]|uniref:Aminotransferase class I/classII large domain-containing protein n=1 Tax=Oleoguttula mirabilis TaxID=1507867 RepID=A0AAV9JJY4_9PEZI|nr:hypothetical protein LTR36_003404 [Oleoguttula mirabilis]